MIKFNKEDEGRYFISVSVTDGYSPEKLKQFLSNEFQIQPEKCDSNELLIPIREAMGFSLNHLSAVVNRKCEAVLYDFIVDMEEPYQRYSARDIDYQLFATM